MRRFTARIRNFYEEDDTQHARIAPQPEVGVEPLPQPYSATSQPTAHHNSRASHRQSTADLAHRIDKDVDVAERSSSGSSASIEDIIPWDAFPVHAAADAVAATTRPDGRSLSADEYVSLRQLQASVSEAERDIRRLRALMVKAVWHSLTQPSDDEERQARKAAGEGKLQDSGRESGRGRHARNTAAATTFTSEATLSSDATTGTFFNEKPFLPPDRYPTLPPLSEKPDHFHVNLSRALSAAHRAGLLERHHAWLQQRQQQQRSSEGAATAAGAGASASASFSVRQTALRRVSQLSTTANSASWATHRLGRQRTGRGGSTVKHATDTSKSVYELEEERVRSSVSLVILRVARDRAVATLFLRQLRLDAYQRQLLQENVSLRYRYYLQRRVLRGWLACARQHRMWRAQFLQQLVSHWQRYVQRRRALHERLHRWRDQLRHRGRAFAACQRSQLLRCWHHWTRAFTWHRERRGLYETAAQFAKSHHRARLGLHGDATDAREEEREVFALLNGSAVAAKGSGVVATPVGYRLVLQRLFQAWKVRTERQLTAHLAVWHRAQRLRRCVVRAACARARALAQRNHRQRKEALQVTSAAVPKENTGDPTMSTTAEKILPPPRAPMRIFTTHSSRRELLKYKTSAASSIAHAAQLRRCFGRWCTRFHAHMADRYRRQCLYVHVVRRWIGALTTRCRQKEWKAVVLGRWIVAAQNRRDAAAAARLHAFLVLRRVLHLWRTHLTLRMLTAGSRLRGCFDRWRERAALHAGTRALRRAALRRLLRRWRIHAHTRMDTHANLCVAATLFETGLLLGCVRQWRLRTVAHRRIRFAWEVLMQLRQERLCRRCFLRWKRRAFGPAAGALPPHRQQSSSAPSPALSLLV